MTEFNSNKDGRVLNFLSIISYKFNSGTERKLKLMSEVLQLKFIEFDLKKTNFFKKPSYIFKYQIKY